MELDNPVLQSFEEGRLDHRSLATRLAPVSCSGDLLVGVLVHPPESLEGRPQLQDVEIVRHKVVNDGQLMVLLKETMEPQRERLGFRMHVSLQQFCRNICDQEKLKPRKRSHEDQSQSLGEASSPLPSPSCVGVLQELVLVHHPEVRVAPDSPQLQLCAHYSIDGGFLGILNLLLGHVCFHSERKHQSRCLLACRNPCLGTLRPGL